ncbi:MAG: isoamylase early set domain-containing protein [Planctomycetota bacterium]|nr:isoamylase early set domain-containing protein [Planctomycetota bacterium]
MVTIDGEWVSFSFYRPSAKAVHLAGDFNNWEEAALPMRGRAGYWTAKMRLPAGEFRFRYLADGEWFTDYAAFGVEPGDFGLDSVLRVPPVTLVVNDPASQTGSAAA